MLNKPIAAALIIAALAAPARAQLSALIVLEPTERKDGLMVSRIGLESGLTKVLGQEVKASSSSDLTDAMRATRSKGFDVFVAPPQVVASALAHGYELVGNTDPAEQYVLVARAAITSAAEMRKGRIYLPQQDSIYTYLARGMLTAHGLSFQDLGQVQYARYPQAGLTALSLRLAEATVIRRSDWDAWSGRNPGVARQLAISGLVPGGLSVAVRKDLPAELRLRLAKWFGSSAPTIGMKPVAQHTGLTAYRRVAELGTFTPNHLPGAAVVDVEDVSRLMAQGAVVVDTRNEAEYKQHHIDGAIFVPYHEKSLKDVAYDDKLDDFSGLASLDKSKPTIFHCNGPECWKSYKASRQALASGFRQVYWFRGGMPAWQAAGH